MNRLSGYQINQAARLVEAYLHHSSFTSDNLIVDDIMSDIVENLLSVDILCFWELTQGF